MIKWRLCVNLCERVRLEQNFDWAAARIDPPAELYDKKVLLYVLMVFHI